VDSLYWFTGSGSFAAGNTQTKKAAFIAANY